jgi:hypothetical protein
MNSKTSFALVLGLAGISVAGLASAGALTEYGSSASWDAAVSNVSTYQIAQIPGLGGGYGSGTQELGPLSATFGPGTFTGNTQSAAIYGIPGSEGEFSDDPQARSDHTDNGSVTVAFSAADDITALAFDLEVGAQVTGVDISVNGSAIAPVSPGFFGVTDAKSPITSITFTEENVPGREMDVVGSYQTATAAPEISPMAAPAALTLLLGLLAVLDGKRRSTRRAF